MDKTKLAELKDRRQKLKEEIRLKKLREGVVSELAHLESLGESYSIYYRLEHLNWIDAHVQIRKRDGYSGIHGDFQVDVDDSMAISDIRMRAVDLDSEKFTELFSSLIPDHSSVIVCHQGDDPELKISLNAFLSHPSKFISHPETWIITADKSWIIEYIWEQGVVRFIQLKDATPILVKKIIIEEE